MPKLTKTFVDGLVADDDRDQLFFDTELRGFGIRISRGGVRSYIAQGRVVGTPGTTPVRLTIGSTTVFTVQQARDQARELLRQMRLGKDPRAARRSEAVSKITLQEVTDQYLARDGKLRDSSKGVIRWHLGATFKDWKDKPIAAITSDMVRKKYKAIATKGLHGNREGGSPGAASQGFAVLGALLAYAGRQFTREDGTPLVSRAPVDSLKDDRIRLQPRTSRILDHKVGPVWSMLKEWRNTTGNREAWTSIDLVMFLLLTGLRIHEAASLRWEQVHLDDGWFHLPNPKNGNAVGLPLSTQAVALLKLRHKPKATGYVFASGWSKSGHVTDPRHVMEKVSSINGSHITPHSLRRTMTNISLRCCRIEKFRTDLLTNHLTRDVVSAHYFDTSNLQWLKPEAQQIADWIEQAADQSSGKNVIQAKFG